MLKSPMLQALENHLLKKADNDPEFVITIVTDTKFKLSDGQGEVSNEIDGVMSLEFPIQGDSSIVSLVRHNECVIIRSESIKGFYV